MLLLAKGISGFDVTSLKTVAMLIFFGLFLGVLLRLILTRPGHFREAASLPLEEDPESSDGALR